MGHSPKFWESPSSETTGPIEKIKGGFKNGMDILYLHAKFGIRSIRSCKKEKLVVFVFLFVCHALDLELE